MLPKTFVKPAAEPPVVRLNEMKEVNIESIEFEAAHKTDDGKDIPDQLKFTMTTDDGYRITDWIRFYNEPGARSKMGELVDALSQALDQDILSPEEFTAMLKQYGRAYVKCSGFRDYKGKQYPNFDLLTNTLPQKQVKLVELVYPDFVSAKNAQKAGLIRDFDFDEKRGVYIGIK